MNQQDKTTKREFVSYKLVSDSCPVDFGLKIEEYLDRECGWEPYGNPFCTSGSSDWNPMFYQAMVTYLDDEEPAPTATQTQP